MHSLDSPANSIDPSARIDRPVCAGFSDNPAEAFKLEWADGVGKTWAASVELRERAGDHFTLRVGSYDHHRRFLVRIQ